MISLGKEPLHLAEVQSKKQDFNYRVKLMLCKSLPELLSLIYIRMFFKIYLTILIVVKFIVYSIIFDI